MVRTRAVGSGGSSNEGVVLLRGDSQVVVWLRQKEIPGCEREKISVVTSIDL